MRFVNIGLDEHEEFYIPSGAAAFAPTEPKPIFFGAAAAAAAGADTCPNPSLFIDNPSLSTSLVFRTWVDVEDVVAAVAVFFVFSSSLAFSASGSYPSFSIRSASSLAFFSAASKSKSSSTATAFLAPNFVAFLAPSIFVFFAAWPVAELLIAEDVVVRETGGVAAGVEEPDPGFSGDLGLPMPAALEPGVRAGELVRPTTGGVAVRVGGGVGRLIAGLSHEEKKSSSSSAAGAASSAPSTTTSSG